MVVPVKQPTGVLRSLLECPDVSLDSRGLSFFGEEEGGERGSRNRTIVQRLERTEVLPRFSCPVGHPGSLVTQQPEAVLAPWNQPLASARLQPCHFYKSFSAPWSNGLNLTALCSRCYFDPWAITSATQLFSFFYEVP